MITYLYSLFLSRTSTLQICRNVDSFPDLHFFCHYYLPCFYYTGIVVYSRFDKGEGASRAVPDQGLIGLIRRSRPSLACA